MSSTSGLSLSSPTTRSATVGISLVILAFVVVIMALMASPWRAMVTDDSIVERAYWNAPQKGLSVEQAMGGDYQPFSQFLGIGNHERDVWLRLSIDVVGGDPMVLQIQPMVLESVEVYQQADDGTWKVSRSGTALPFEDRCCRTFNTVVPLLPSSEAESVRRTVYVRLDTITSGVMVEAVSDRQARRLDTLLVLVGGLYVGLMILMLVISVLAYVITRDSLWLGCLLLDIASGLFSASQLGLIQRFLLPGGSTLGDDLYLLTICLVMLAHLNFWPRICTMFSVPRALHLVYRLPLAVLPLWPVALLMERHDLILLSVNLTFVLISTSGLLVGMAGRHDNTWLLWLFRLVILGQSLFPVYWLLGSMTGMELAPAVVIYSVAPSNLLVMVLVIILLAYHTSAQIQERIQLQVDKREAETRLAIESERRAEAVGFLSMVIHEVKNPLNHIRLAIGNLLFGLEGTSPQAQRLQRVEASVAAIDSLLERTLELDAAANGTLPLRIEQVALAPLVRDALVLTPQAERIEIDIPEGLTVRADPSFAVLMLKNLLENAVVYSPAESLVQVQAERLGEQVQLRVINRVGPGGYPDFSRLFGKSYHSDSLQNDGRTGLGLGLYWVHEVAARMSLQLSCEVHEPTIQFNLWFPR